MFNRALLPIDDLKESDIFTELVVASDVDYFGRVDHRLENDKIVTRI